jgi:CRISPR-associated endonuclease Cas2
MAVFLISYDLTEPGKNYPRLSARLTELGAERVLYSEWMISTTWTHVQLRDDLLNFIDATDRIMVLQLTKTAAWRNLLIANEKFKRYFD